MTRISKNTTSAAASTTTATLDSSFGIPQELSPAEDFVATRNRALLQTAADAVQGLDESGLGALQSVLKHGETFGYWFTPLKWAPTEMTHATMNIDLRKRILDFMPEAHQKLVREAEESETNFNGARVQIILNGAVLTLTRYLVLLRMGPAGLIRGAASLDPTTVKKIAYTVMPAMLALAASKWLAALLLEDSTGNLTGVVTSLNVGYLSRIHVEDFDGFSKYLKKHALNEVQRMHSLYEKGCWNDVPPISEALKLVSHIAGPAIAPEKEEPVDSHLPLPDDYVSEMGRKSLWLISNLAPNLLCIAKEIRAIWRRTEDPTSKPRTVKERRSIELVTFLRTYLWRDSQGGIITEPPFRLRMSQQGKTSQQSRTAAKALAKEAQKDDGSDFAETDEFDVAASEPTRMLEWPPRAFASIMGLISAVQSAHLFVVALSTGGRRSETLALRRSCVYRERNGMPYANGRTFKLVQRHDGVLRDWVLPDIAVQAIEQQVQLVTLTEIIEGVRPVRSAEPARLELEPADHLWFQVAGHRSDRTQPLLDLGQTLRTYAKTLSMDTAPGGQNFRPHRFRKTVARLVALALTQGPKILMDVFGHKSIEMTLYYILTDKDLRAEIEQVSRELRVMRAKDVVEAMVKAEDAQTEGLSLGSYGGPAALMVQRAIDVQRGRLHRQSEDWGAESAMELAQILTLQGKAWQFVRPGVICTKFPGTESGPCNKSKGHPEPSRCQTNCKHRLEEAFLREDVDGAIRDSLDAYNDAGASGEDLVQALWAGQIRTHIGRFEDLRVKWMADPTVQHLLKSTTGAPA